MPRNRPIDTTTASSAGFISTPRFQAVNSVSERRRPELKPSSFPDA